MGKTSIQGSLEALEQMMMYLAEAVSKDNNISLEAAKPKALELVYASSKKILGAMPAPKGKSGNEFQMNFRICKELAAQLKYEAQRNNTLKPLADKFEYHIKKLDGG